MKAKVLTEKVVLKKKGCSGSGVTGNVAEQEHTLSKAKLCMTEHGHCEQVTKMHARFLCQTQELSRVQFCADCTNKSPSDKTIN